MNEGFNDIELAQYRERIRRWDRELDKLMAERQGFELMKAVERIEIACQLFNKRLTEL